MADLQQIVDDLRAESNELDALVAPLADAGWTAPTPAAGWTVAHQIGHLLWTDRGALLAVTDEDAFADIVKTALDDPIGFVNTAADELAVVPPAELLADWRATRSQLHDALLTVDDGRKLPWFGPPMSGPSMATARIMETGHTGSTSPTHSASPGPPPPGCGPSHTSGSAPVISRSSSTACSRRANRFTWNFAHPTAASGRGAPPMRRNASPAPPRISAFWSLSADRRPIST